MMDGTPFCMSNLRSEMRSYAFAFPRTQCFWLHVYCHGKFAGATMRLEHHQSRLHLSAPSGFCIALQDAVSGGHTLQLRLQASIPEGWGAVFLKAAQMDLRLLN